MLGDISQTYFSYVKQMRVSVYMGQVHIIALHLPNKFHCAV